MTTPFRFAAFDLDGTVLRDDGYLPGIEAGLANLCALGITSWLVTGRGAVALREVEPLPTLFRQLLISSGNARYLGDRVVAVNPLPDGAVAACAQGIDAVVETTEALVATSRKAAAAYAVSHRLPRARLLIDADGAGPGVPLAMTVFDTSELADRVAGLAVELDRLTAYRAAVVRPRGSCKANGVQRALAEHDATLADVIAFGDAYNDSCLLAAAGCGVAVVGADACAVRHSSLRLAGSLGDFLTALDAPPLSPGRRTDRPAPCLGLHFHPAINSTVKGADK